MGIATSKTGAVIHDITRVGWRRHPGVPFYLYPVSVQGAGAAREIAAAVEALDRLDAVDVIIVARGGGSLEDLWEFNEEVLARAIFNCQKACRQRRRARDGLLDFRFRGGPARAHAIGGGGACGAAARSAFDDGGKAANPYAPRLRDDAVGSRRGAVRFNRAACAPNAGTAAFGVIAERVQGLTRRLSLLYKQALEQ